jgi:hypothetical protein
MENVTQRIIRLVLLSRKARIYRELGHARGDTRRIVRASWLEEAALRKAKTLKNNLEMRRAGGGETSTKAFPFR